MMWRCHLVLLVCLEQTSTEKNREILSYEIYTNLLFRVWSRRGRLWRARWLPRRQRRWRWPHATRKENKVWIVSPILVFPSSIWKKGLWGFYAVIQSMTESSKDIPRQSCGLLGNPYRKHFKGETLLLLTRHSYKLFKEISDRANPYL